MKLTIDDLLTPAVRARLQAVLDFGAKKHAEPGPDAWPRARADIHVEHANGHIKLGEPEEDRNGSLFFRFDDECMDDESGLCSIDHAAVRLLMAIATQVRER